jgi:hypothetical protein
MPEGDTIFRIARTLDEALAGKSSRDSKPYCQNSSADRSREGRFNASAQSEKT